MGISCETKIDIKENYLFNTDRELLELLLKDQTSNQNIIWAVDDYSSLGENYSADNFITVETITGENGEVIKPRIEKSKLEKSVRIKDKAEVFTPSYICNHQNNLIDEIWFKKKNVFNTETADYWITNEKTVIFPDKRSWKDYVLDIRLEITCGEAPYITSRYDVVSGRYIEPKNRIGLLDRKLRVISENITQEHEWLNWAKKAVQSVYGYDWQGDNIILARENILYTVIEHHEQIYKSKINVDYLKELAMIISWNIWQMDGLKYVIPNSCKSFDLLGNIQDCIGCKTNNNYLHTGLYCKIMDWENNKVVKFIDTQKRTAGSGK